MTTLEIRILGLVGLVLAFIVALAVVATTTALVALVRRAYIRIHARRTAAPRPAPRLKEAA